MTAFSVLAREALRDAARRRALVAAAVASALAGLAIVRCGHCEASISVQGEALSAQAGQVAALARIASVALIALWTYAVAALLASDALAAAIEDGVAEAVLARPVSRDTFVLARLAGVWAGAFALGAVLLALAVGLAGDHASLKITTVLRAGLAIGIVSWGIAALAMVVSLWLPRAATLLLLGAVGAAAVGIEVTGLFGGRPGGFAGAVVRYGPAWLAAPVSTLAAWLSDLSWSGPPPWAHARAIAWAALATCALVARFRRLELPR